MDSLPNCLGLDVGTHRIGVAGHPPAMRQAVPLETVDARDRNKAVARLVALCEAREVTRLVVGWPVDMDGVARRATRRVDELVEALQKGLKRAGRTCDVVRWDERLTTTAAESMLIEADFSRAKRKKVVDQVAATHILEGYLRSLDISLG